MATIKKVKKAQAGKKVTPTYKNLKMGVKNEQYQMSGQNRDIKPSSKDSARYRGGFEQGLKGMKGMPNEGQVEKMGRWEGQNVGKKKGMKTGGTLAPSKKSVGKTIGKLNKAKSGSKISKKK
jgi:soluble cytochrome b562